MDSIKPAARYCVGDLVHCWYAWYQFGYIYDVFDEDPPIVGIVVEVDYAEYEDWPAEVIYVVYCTDGSYRFFIEEEMSKLT